MLCNRDVLINEITYTSLTCISCEMRSLPCDLRPRVPASTRSIYLLINCLFTCLFWYYKTAAPRNKYLPMYIPPMLKLHVSRVAYCYCLELHMSLRGQFKGT